MKDRRWTWAVFTSNATFTWSSAEKSANGSLSQKGGYGWSRPKRPNTVNWIRIFSERRPPGSTATKSSSFQPANGLRPFSWKTSQRRTRTGACLSYCGKRRKPRKRHPIRKIIANKENKTTKQILPADEAKSPTSWKTIKERHSHTAR